MLTYNYGITRNSLYEPSPNYLMSRKTILSDEERDRRRRTMYTSRSGVWIDPFPEISGTLPEKMVYAELQRRQIAFEFQAQRRARIPEIDFDQWYSIDFFLPDFNMIIDPLSAYHHSLPDVIERDAFKFAVHDYLGIKTEMWWDYEIYEDLDGLFMRAGLGGRPLSTRRRYHDMRIRTSRDKDDTTDHSAGVVTLNQRRKRYQVARHAGATRSTPASRGTMSREVSW